MKIIDLSMLIYNGMPVYPGDPKVEIKQVHSLEKQGWVLRKLSFGSHTGTHLNVPSHMLKNGKTLNDLPLDNFYGPTIVYSGSNSLKSGIGVIFRNQNIDKEIVKSLIKTKPQFVGLSARYEFEIEVERELLKAGIVSYENLENTELLPIGKQFMFYGFPLKIKDGDGSPVRAIAVIEK